MSRKSYWPRLVLGVMLGLAALVAQAEERFYLQIGVFSDAATATGIRQQIESFGFNVSQRQVEVIGRPAFVVLVGPYARSREALYDKNRLADVGWSAAVKRYPAPPKPKPPKPPTFRTTYSGSLAGEVRHFTDAPLYSTEQHETTASLAIQPEFHISWNQRSSSLTFVPFVRVGDADEERNHADIRELMWLNAWDDWELRLGVGKVFWGVTESRHLVDVINQVDLVENTDEEDKLGQPMANLSWFSDWGTFDVFALPLFRERSFPGEEGRLRGPLVVDTEQDAIYESPDEENHLDWAVRWSHYIGDWDIGVSHFSGTGRDPRFVPGLNAQGQPVLIPRYNLIDQTGLTLQAIMGEWLWKLEATSTRELDQRYTEAVAGFEYTRVGIFRSAIDLGFIAEYLYDERGEQAPQPFEDDVMLGLRWAFNDMQSSEILMGVIIDRDGTATSSSVEASRRLGQSWRLTLEYRGLHAVEPQDISYLLRNDNYIQLGLGYYY
ncbi:hypothetical protein Tel_10320 [Candidatus Tenderia electrophaga]|jgi:hypothetical protein|uniref:SPOR domain-containing protein n=1 Tax=Candidatus Tenderia electrophaga TaxID=1748243 RepID=A0A0S2TEC9_9GAMM|nr:hypothetical protein Tel_10320 [Candidatus Tenderia electrophaga]